MTEGHDDRLHRSPSQWAARSLGRMRLTAAICAVVMLAVLAWAPTKELLQPWRKTQARYNAAAVTYGLDQRPLKVHQIWLPDAEKADRCGTCHLGAAGEPPIESTPPFASHPSIVHTPERFGCTYCHAGQGWATVEKDAHGLGGSWPHPIFSRERTEAGCGTCHSGLELPLPEEVEEAPDLIDEFGCLKCHAEDGQSAPSLTGIGLRGIPEDWAAKHRGLTPPDDDTSTLVAADAAELKTLDAWLTTRVGASHLARGKMVFHQLGCLGCHRRDQVGGDVGPDLTGIGDKDVRDVSSEAADSQTLPGWIFDHLMAPQELDAESRMPPVDSEELERESDLDDLVTYLLSLREDDLPASLTPPDRAKTAFSLSRDFPTSGRGLYVVFCGACHGFYATGNEIETLGLLAPMIGTRGYLATVTPRYLRSSILRGRRGRFMPAWGPDDGGLETLEVERIVDYLVSKGFRVKSLEKVSGPGDPVRGREVFERRCAACHVNDKTGEKSTRFGRDLLAPGGLSQFTEQTLYGAIMHGWVEEGMPSFAFLKSADVRDLLALLRPLLSPTPVTELASTHDGRHSHLGNQIWGAKCLACHGEQGEGSADGPLLNSAPYLEWADDNYLAARIATHRGEVAQASVGTLSDADADAILDLIRSWSGHVEPTPAPLPKADAVTRGRALYPARCTECHGENGHGKTGPALANRDFLELVSRPFLVMTILEGRKGTAMQAWRQRTELPVSLQDAFDLADYILSLAAEPGESIATTPSSTGTHSNQGD